MTTTTDEEAADGRARARGRCRTAAGFRARCARHQHGAFLERVREVQRELAWHGHRHQRADGAPPARTHRAPLARSRGADSRSAEAERDEPIVVGYDGSPGSADALALGRQLAGAAGRPLALVVRAPAADPRRCRAGRSTRRASCGRRRTRRWPERRWAPEAERHAVCGESVARGLQAFAERERASAIVVGCPVPGRCRTHRGGHRRSEPAARSALRGRPRAARLRGRPPGGAAGGSSSATPTATRRVAPLRVAAGLGAVVRRDRACRVGRRQAPLLVRRAQRVRGGGRGEAQADLDQVLRRLASAVATEGVVLDGDPARCLLEQADGWADLIVTGSRGYGPKRQVLLGSVSAGVLAAATVPVVVTPRGAETDLVANRPRAAPAPEHPAPAGGPQPLGSRATGTARTGHDAMCNSRWVTLADEQTGQGHVAPACRSRSRRPAPARRNPRSRAPPRRHAPARPSAWP